MNSMKQSKRVAFVVTVHWSQKIRPDGQDLLLRFLSSIYEFCKFNFHVYIVDNQSQWQLQIPDDDKCTYLRIDNQHEKGLTGAWNLGLYKAFQDEYDLLINCNDDLWFNETINSLIEQAFNHNDSENIIFCPLTNGVIERDCINQYSDKPGKGVTNLDCKTWIDTPNGFLFCFTREHYKKYRFKDSEYFNHDNKFNGGDGKWGGQEGQWIENQPKGNHGLVINECFVHHDKIRAWQIPRDIERGIKI